MYPMTRAFSVARHTLHALHALPWQELSNSDVETQDTESNARMPGPLVVQGWSRGGPGQSNFGEYRQSSLSNYKWGWHEQWPAS